MDELPFASMVEPSASVTKTSSVDRWGAIAGVSQEREDRLPVDVATGKWQRIYNLFQAKDEKGRDDVFAAVNAYFAINGCSPLGRYSREVKTEGGTRVSASDIVKVTGRLEGDVRQFLRARLKDSYESLKYSGYLKRDESALAKAEEKGIPRHLVHLLADWFKDCEYFTAEEADIYVKVSRATIADAKDRRRDVEPTRRADGQSDEVTAASPPPAFAGGRGPSAVSY